MSFNDASKALDDIIHDNRGRKSLKGMLNFLEEQGIAEIAIGDETISLSDARDEMRDIQTGREPNQPPERMYTPRQSYIAEALTAACTKKVAELYPQPA